MNVSGGSNVDEAALLRFVLRAFVLCRPEIGYVESPREGCEG